MPDPLTPAPDSDLVRAIRNRILRFHERYESREKTRDEIMAIVREHRGDVHHFTEELLDAILEAIER
jgi:hypothetical protein